MSEVKVLTPTEWMAFTRVYPGYDHYVSMFKRPGFYMLMAVVEHYHFNPSTPLNGLYQVNAIEWEDMNWLAFSVPHQFHGVIQQTADSLAMAITPHRPILFHMGRDRMLASTDPRRSLDEIRAKFAGVMGPRVAAAISGMSTFPGPDRRVHAVENNERHSPVKFTHLDYEQVFRRENILPDLFATGARPDAELILRFIAGEIPAEELS
jgi:hypothetical protein